MPTEKAQKTKELEPGDLQSNSFYRTRSRWEREHEKEGEEENTLFMSAPVLGKEMLTSTPIPLPCHVRKASKKGSARMNSELLTVLQDN